MIETLANHLEARDDIMLETTLATRRYLGAIPQWKALGYDVELHFLRLPSVAAAIARVGRRVAAGGHDIPRQDIERRFHRGLEYLALYKPAVDQWALFDNSDDGLELVMMGTRDER